MIPRLHYLLVVDLHLSEIPAIVLLLSPSLRTLDILFAIKEEEDRQIAPHVVDSLLRTLPLMAPNLETFSCDIDLRLGHGYVNEFRHLARLKMVAIHSEDALDEGALRTLSAIATLQGLTCTIDRSSSSALTLHPYVFPHLKGLHVMGSFDDLTAFIKACHLPSVTGLILRVKEPPSAGKPADSFATICGRFNPLLLTSFTVAIRDAFTSESPRPGSLLQYFEPVLAFPDIESFHLSFSHIIPSIRDNDLARCGAAWRHLSSFRVSHLVIGQDAPEPPDFVRPTLSGLVDLARRCPHLESFRAPALHAKVFPDKNTTLPLSHNLRALSITDSVTLSSLNLKSRAFLEVVGVIDQVFPSIKLPDNAPAKATKNMKGWDKLTGLLKTMRLRREG
ncbi:hypothetical protein V8D89_001069 [Ganoderma adspersum]